MGAPFNNPALVHNNDLVGILDGGYVVGNDDAGPGLHDFTQALENFLFGVVSTADRQSSRK